MRGDTVMNLPTPGYGNVEVNNSGASNSGNTSGGLKKPLIIIAAILGVVIIGATAYFMFSGMNSTDSLLRSPNRGPLFLFFCLKHSLPGQQSFQ